MDGHLGMAAASVAAFFASIVLHELAHSLVARRFRIPVKSITLFVFGGVAQITREAARPLQELLMALAGPLTSIALGAAFAGLWRLLGAQADRPIDYVLVWLAIMNAALGVFNLLPAFPMDGGRVFRALAWMVTRAPARAGDSAGGLDRAGVRVGAGAGAGACWRCSGGTWCSRIRWQAAPGWCSLGCSSRTRRRQSLLQNRLVQELARYRAEDVMLADIGRMVDAEQPVGPLARGTLELNPRAVFLVSDGDRLAGVLSGYDLLDVPVAAVGRDAGWLGDGAAGDALRATSADDRLVSDVLLEMEMEDLLHMPVVEAWAGHRGGRAGPDRGGCCGRRGCSARPGRSGGRFRCAARRRLMMRA
ncbi:site-2 protease family protein [Tepidiforma flava]|uniref:Site-2 protease family protein n=1 Tax=Tepidiforma flava TaxID=3004094 RepID=A0ABY7M472_9CHLR|nr:site-2 protease family protein [Tepidiforma flava]WBL34962.1 site-2 protease family protein [Tepidiforma flava]